jgi:integrase
MDDDIPEVLTLGNTGRNVRREDADQLTDAERRTLWAEVGPRSARRIVWPFGGHDHDADAFAAPRGGFAPAMRRLEAVALGWDDVALQTSHDELFGGHADRLDPDAVDTREQMEVRKRMYDRVVDRLYGG